jgi:hypothetical protein
MKTIELTCWRCCEITKGADVCPACGESQAVDVIRKSGRITVVRKQQPLSQFELKCRVLDALIDNLRKDLDWCRSEMARQHVERQEIRKGIREMSESFRKRIAAVESGERWQVSPMTMGAR